jgi:hypothetical protein
MKDSNLAKHEDNSLAKESTAIILNDEAGNAYFSS